MFYQPVETAIRPGRPVEAVAQEADLPASLQVVIGSATEVSARARLAVVWWHQRAGEFDEFMQIAYDMPLAVAAETQVIPFSELAAPYLENLICFRACRDRALCDCNRFAQVAFASVLVAVDSDGSGALSFEEIRREQVGGTPALIGWGPYAQSSSPIEWSTILGGSGRIAAGFAGYVDVDGESGLTPVTDSDETFDVGFCPQGDAGCTFPVHRVFCYPSCEQDWGLNRFGL